MSIRSLLTALLLAAVGNAFGQALPATDPVPRVVFPRTVSGNSIILGPVTADAANAAKFSFGAAANGAVFANTGASLATAGGASVAVNVAGEIPKLAVSKAIGRFALKVVYPLQVGMALYDLGKELGFNLTGSSSGVTVTKSDPTICTTAPCYEYATNPRNNPYGSATTGWFPTADAACGRAGQMTRDVYGDNRWTSGLNAGGDICNFYNQDGLVSQNGIATRSVAPAAGAELPSTVEAFTDAIAAKSGWPSSSALARTTVDAIKSGESLDVQPTTVTGPASQQVSQSVTNNTANNTTTTTTTTNNYTYDGAKVTVTPVTNRSTVNNSTGATTNVTTTTTPTLAPEADLKVCGLPGGPACKIDESGTPEPAASDAYSSKLDDLKADQIAHGAKIAGTDDKSFFSGWGDLFVTPPVQVCRPYAMPTGVSIDPCPVVEGGRMVMAWLWALSAFWLCLGMVRESI